MKNKPILFKSEMVRAIFEGRKTQTRRIVKLPAEAKEGCKAYWDLADKPQWAANNEFAFIDMAFPTDTYPTIAKCPYGKVGDKLWVRETYARWSNSHDSIIYQDDLEFKKLGEQNVILNRLRANPKTAENMECVGYWQKVPSIFMPKEIARLWLEITNIRVERLQNINEEDAIKEGIEPNCSAAEYQTLWDSINAKGGYSWQSNPFIWVIEFKKVERNYEQVQGLAKFSGKAR